jgi:hypothetical protein
MTTDTICIIKYTRPRLARRQDNRHPIQVPANGGPHRRPTTDDGGGDSAMMLEIEAETEAETGGRDGGRDGSRDRGRDGASRDGDMVGVAMVAVGDNAYLRCNHARLDRTTS